MVELKFHCAMPIFIARQWIRTPHRPRERDVRRYSLMPLLYYRPDRAQFQAQSASNRQGRSGAPLDAIYCRRDRALGARAARGVDGLRVAGRPRRRARARAIDLPLSLYTQWYWKIDLHNLLHFLSLRVDPHAQYEIRAFAVVMAGMLQRVAPLTFEAWVDYDVAGTTLSRGELAAIQRSCRVAAGGSSRRAGEVRRKELEHLGLANREVDELLAKLTTPPSSRTSRSTLSRGPLARGVRARDGAAVPEGGPPVSECPGRRRGARAGRPALQPRPLHGGARDLGEQHGVRPRTRTGPSRSSSCSRGGPPSAARGRGGTRGRRASPLAGARGRSKDAGRRGTGSMSRGS
jgi:thymidylate synthase (FAD)